MIVISNQGLYVMHRIMATGKAQLQLMDVKLLRKKSIPPSHCQWQHSNGGFCRSA